MYDPRRLRELACTIPEGFGSACTIPEGFAVFKADPRRPVPGFILTSVGIPA